MKPLKEIIKSDGFKLTQVRRVKNVALYEKTKEGYKGYEVVLIRERSARTIKNGLFVLFVEAGEFYPRSDEWGQYGWTLSTLEGANEKLELLLRTREES